MMEGKTDVRRQGDERLVQKSEISQFYNKQVRLVLKVELRRVSLEDESE